LCIDYQQQQQRQQPVFQIAFHCIGSSTKNCNAALLTLASAAAAAAMLCRLTTPERVTRLPRGVNHFNTFSHPLGRAAVIKALKELIN
jgi:hypothetical protein